LAKWSILVFSFLIALNQLKVGGDIIKIFVMGIVIAVAIALGLAFGLGGQGHAGEWINNLKRKIQG